ncbi:MULTISPECIES: helix-turn-helix transcriptional regulator [Arsenophonus]|uniref:AraC family transcriptional regulator n=1 Tax=Arsenophonus TaxID=637 RepID=UPI0015D709CB|nr:helix-turn-helix transcriptional regulator [Arsenophonus endosymbiont of Apis mellifera]
MKKIRHRLEPNIIEPKFIVFRNNEWLGDTECQLHRHSFGQLIYVVKGVIEMQVATQHYIAPPEFCIWIPCGVEHATYNKKSVKFNILDICQTVSHVLCKKPCIIRQTPIFHTILLDFYARNITQPTSAEDIRLANVLIDQLKRSPIQKTYLPASKDKFLAPILAQLQQNPADNTALAIWAKRVYTSERTLSRRCQQELGMSFSEWRQRLRFLHAIMKLEQGQTVQQVAFDVGYSSASAFITMFQQISGTTPERFRQKSDAEQTSC